MPEVAFAITGVTPVTRGLTPLLHFKLQITPAPDAEAIHLPAPPFFFHPW